ncbi:hypothetical protein GF352_03170 [archaeon]|nr:hypothetical protein [archaeon]
MSKCSVGDCSYNVMKQLVKLNQLLYNIDSYIKDAKRKKHADCVKAFKELKKDTMKNAEALKEVLKKHL